MITIDRLQKLQDMLDSDDNNGTQTYAQFVLSRFVDYMNTQAYSDDRIFGQRCKALQDTVNDRLDHARHGGSLIEDDVSHLIAAATRIATDYQNERNAKIVAAIPLGHLYIIIEPLRSSIEFSKTVVSNPGSSEYYDKILRDWSTFVTTTQHLMNP